MWYIGGMTEGLFLFLLGLCVGSFLNVLIYRFPRSLSIAGRSVCPKCRKRIRWYDNVPVVSYFILQKKCRSCHSPISARYPMVELLTGALFLLVYYSSSNSLWLMVYGLWLVGALVVIFFVDLKHQIIPDQVIVATMIVSLAYRFFTSSQLLITNYFPAFIAAGLFFLLLHFITKGRGMGFGDVKLAFLMGLVLGFPNIILALYLAFLTGAIVGVILILGRKKRFGQHIPFGPFLAGSTLLTFLWGTEILKWLTVRLF